MFKRALAGVAAAALAATGLMLGAGAASAAGGDPETPAAGTTITVHKAVTGHTYAAYDFATFTFAGEVDGEATATVETTDDTLGNLIETAAGQGIQTWYNDNPQYKGNPAAYLATLSGSALREFVDGMTNLADSLMDADGFVTAAADGDAVITGLDSGHWYFVTDTVGTGDDVTVRGKIAVVATTMVDNDTKYSLAVVGDDRQTKIDMMGEFNAKADSPTPTDKDVSKTAFTDQKMQTNLPSDGSVEVGQTVYYKVEVTVPQAADEYTDYTMTIKDTASAGIAVQNDFAVSVVGGSSLVKGEDYTIDPDPVQSDGTTDTTVTITVKNANELANKTITVTYSGVITKEITNTGTATNKVDVDGTGHTTHTVTSTGFQFTKYGVDKGQSVNTPVDELAKLEGVSFTILNGDSSASVLKFTKNDEGAYVLDAANGTKTVLTGEDGVVTVKGLKAGDYTVVESDEGAEGYSKAYLAEFTIHVAADGTVTMPDGYTNAHGLAKVDNTQKNVNVYNVKDFTQLPLTGAAGTVLFTVLGLLIAGASALVYMKSRNVKHALRG
ncbi:isopeptide-forming domain-containing fimbrial protein [Bifidobacterium pullorum]|uniref:isopeptide-forming domain-containing fimbrial protein n=1 Tax=Bifidobacterium pullorum TaxID=78448 RepID=UPI0025A44BE8|nr:isopeptide-forming domain-containing fimbrial protein [Bifidobacterium pullorum]